uniref:C-X-C motif chemokine 11-like n=2 Tax=Sinocyclocheilus grahami TaxID=75366 RepID=A0A672KSR4_SINGR
MKTTTFIVLVCLLVVEVKGHSLDVKGRYICADKGVNKVSRKATEKVEIILPSPSWKRLEIVVTMRGAGQKCLNPGSRFTKKYILTAIQKMSSMICDHSETRKVAGSSLRSGRDCLWGE